MFPLTPALRDVVRFVIFLLTWQSMVETGYAQQVSDTVAPVVSRPANPANAGLNKLSHVHSDVQPSGQPVDFRTVISVSPALSTPTVSGVVNNTLTIGYTAYNLRPDPVNGVLLTTTLQSGVSFESATPMPDRNGQQLAFSLGSMPPLGSVTATLTVTLANASVTQIDNGATAYAYWNGISVTSTGIAAALRTAPVNTNLLQSTVDANTSDSYIQAQAAAARKQSERDFCVCSRPDRISVVSRLVARGARDVVEHGGKLAR
jgi:hypothetical protein